MKSLLIAAVTTATLAACAPATRVILLPQADRETALQVSTGRDRQELTGAYAEADVSGGGSINVGQSNAARVQSRYRALTAVQPQPASIPMRFEPGSSALTPQSRKDLDAALEKATARTSATLVITRPAVGFAPDRIGSMLSDSRARAVRTYLIAHGFAPERIQMTQGPDQNGAGPTASVPAGTSGVVVQMR